MKKTLLSGALLAVGTVLAACAGGAAFVAVGPPPPPRYAVVGVAPGPGYIWTEGFWDLQGRNWVWVPGRWVRPPRAQAVWVRPEWRQEGGRWRYHRGYWRH
jgi:hypothetical protein